jgi:hypothetical protein
MFSIARPGRCRCLFGLHLAASDEAGEPVTVVTAVGPTQDFSAAR